MNYLIKLSIFCLGDSITYGVGTTKGSYPDYIRKEFTKPNKFPMFDIVDVFNLGIPGNTSHDLASRILEEVKNRLYSYDTTLSQCFFIIMIGNNDYRLAINKDSYKENLIIIMQRLKSILPPVRCNILFINPIPDYSKDKSRCFYDLAEYKDVLQRVTTMYNVNLIDIPLKEDCYTEDGIHPNDKGTEMIAFYVKRYMEDKILGRIVINEQVKKEN